jgi:ketosteroid isomerase-like protein
MSEDAVAVVRRGYAAFAELDMDSFIADWHPEIVWDVSGYEGWPGGASAYAGADDILSEFANLMTAKGGLTIERLQLQDLGADRVLALYTECYRDRRSGEPVELEVGVVYELDEGMIQRVDVLTGHDNARAMADARCKSAI